MESLKIKESNYWAIYDFVVHKDNRRLLGTKLQALHRLIQKKGTKIKGLELCDDFAGEKALKISKTEYIAIKRTGGGENFFPCKIKSLLLTEIK